MPTATYANQGHSDVLLIADDGTHWALKPGAPELAGLEITPYAAPVPTSVSPLQARRVLRAAGLLDQVEAAIAAADADTQDAWRYAQVVERRDPTLHAIGMELGLSESAMDDLFRQAAAQG